MDSPLDFQEIDFGKIIARCNGGGGGKKDSTLAFGKIGFGCKHYRRRCKIRAPCCNEIFGCHRCHNEASTTEDGIRSKDVEKVICYVCDTEQPVGQFCMSCGVKFGEYFCKICKIYDDDKISKRHCDDCGICRPGLSEDHFHCHECGICRPLAEKGKHTCPKSSLTELCPICLENFIDSSKTKDVMKCGHRIHYECFKEMATYGLFGQYTCPLCSKTIKDMRVQWLFLDITLKRAETLFPSHRAKVRVFCNDCYCTTLTTDHILFLKCGNCPSYNTRIA